MTELPEISVTGKVVWFDLKGKRVGSVKVQIEVFERVPHLRCSERVVQMRRWQLQVFKDVRGSGPPLFSTQTKVNTARRRGAASGQRRWMEKEV